MILVAGCLHNGAAKNESLTTCANRLTAGMFRIIRQPLDQRDPASQVSVKARGHSAEEATELQDADADDALAGQNRFRATSALCLQSFPSPFDAGLREGV